MDKKNPITISALKKLKEIRSRVKAVLKSEETGEENKPIEETTETKYKGVKIVDNIESNVCQIFFHDFPNPPVRAYLKHHGFKWSPIDQCWSGPRSAQAMFHAEKGIDKMAKLN